MKYPHHDNDPPMEEGHTITLDEKDIEHLLALSTPDFEEALSAHPDSTWRLDYSAFKYLFKDAISGSNWKYLRRNFKCAGFTLAQWPRMMALVQRHTPIDDDAIKRHAALKKQLQRTGRGLVTLFAFVSSVMINGTHMRQILDKAGQSISDDLVRMILERNHCPYHTREELIQGGLPLIIANNAHMQQVRPDWNMLFILMKNVSFIEHCLNDRYRVFSKLMSKNGLQDAAHALWTCNWQAADLECVLGMEICSGRTHRSHPPHHRSFGSNPIDIALCLIRFHQHDRTSCILRTHNYLSHCTQDEVRCLTGIADQRTRETLLVQGAALRRLSPVSYWVQLMASIVAVILLLIALFMLLHTFLIPVLLHASVWANMLGYMVALFVASLCAAPAEHRWDLDRDKSFAFYLLGSYMASSLITSVGLCVRTAYTMPLSPVLALDVIIASTIGMLLVSFLIESFSKQSTFLHFDNDDHFFNEPLILRLHDVWHHRFVNVYLTSPRNH